MTPRRGVRAWVIGTSCGFGRQLLDQLVVAHHGDQPRVRVSARQRSVVEAPAPAQPYAAMIDRQRRHQHHTGLGQGGLRQPGFRRFKQPPKPAGKSARPVLAPPQRQRGAVFGGARNRQQHPLRPAQQRVQHLDGPRLAAHRHEGASRAAARSTTSSACSPSRRASAARTSSATSRRASSSRSRSVALKAALVPVAIVLTMTAPGHTQSMGLPRVMV